MLENILINACIIRNLTSKTNIPCLIKLNKDLYVIGVFKRRRIKWNNFIIKNKITCNDHKDTTKLYYDIYIIHDNKALNINDDCKNKIDIIPEIGPAWYIEKIL